jgi:diguanylate cyclase (GGDEF)-like protein
VIPAAVFLLATLSPILALVVLALLVAVVRLGRRVQALTIEARQDLLTGLPNRRGLKARWHTMAGDKALILVDLVGFKAVNDSHGHIVGDALLRQVAGRLAASITPPGLLARWGGDEFVALIPAERLESQQALIANAQLLPYDLSDSGGPAEVRIGARTGTATGHAELGLAVREAARNLLQSKAEG